MGLIPGSGRSPGKGHGKPLQYSFLENFTDSGAWWVTIHRAAKSQTQLSDTHTHTHTHTLLFTSTEDVGGEEKWEQIAGGLDGLFLL